ncbi:hypothetical protein [Infirmifilum sp. NZ]|uniref:hypothetical protein n=1 Tax=Infirmifilum sp. NZ TaxID=2926850 RepID=UPI00279B814E|nr:hypothetical protein [Infirmifilum sp. NZ]UNQ72730.1 hypothetical protein MOV14_06330 [Infirmifilum sp. NZ]
MIPAPLLQPAVEVGDKVWESVARRLEAPARGWPQPAAAGCSSPGSPSRGRLAMADA